MFAPLTAQLTSELKTVEKVLKINEALRDLLTTHGTSLGKIPPDPPQSADDLGKIVHSVRNLTAEEPDKLDWQVYDHCAALTRIYAAYERFVSDLVAEYVQQLPKLYTKYIELPESVTKQHRRGIGHILLKIGKKGPYKKLEEGIVVGQLASGLSGADDYKLLTEAFFIDRQNLRTGTLVKLFGILGFGNTRRYISTHPAVTNFIAGERPDGGSAEQELDEFVEYRNEAAHKKVENVLSTDAIAKIGHFISALCQALADMVENGILRRRVELGHYSLVLKVAEVHHNGYVAIGIPPAGVTVTVGDELLICSKGDVQKAQLDSLQLNGTNVRVVTGDGATELGIRLNQCCSVQAELRSERIAPATGREAQLRLEDALPLMTDEADIELADVLEPDTNVDAENDTGAD